MTDLANQASQAELLIQFHSALKSQSPAFLRKALKAGLDPNTQQDVGIPGERLHYRIHLIESLFNSRIFEDKEMGEMLGILLESGANPRLAISKDGQTVLMKAFGSNRPNTVRQLVEAGDDVHAADPKGISVLHHACMSNTAIDDSALLELLVQHGADLHVKADNYGRTPLMLLTSKPESLRWMLQRTPERINEQDLDGHTALMYAINSREIESARLLLSHGADVTLCNRKGQDTLAYAHATKEFSANRFSEQDMNEIEQVIDYLRSYVCANQARNMISNIAARAQAGAQGNAP